MSEKTKLGLSVLGAALVLGILGDVLLRSTPWGLNVGLWVTALVTLATALSVWRGVDMVGEGRWLVVPLVLFAALFAWRDSDSLLAINGLALLVALSLAVFRSRARRIVTAGLVDYLYLGIQAAGYGFAGPLPLAVRDIDWGEIRPTRYAPLFAALRGLAIAVPILLVFGALFVAADAVFGRIVSNLLDFDLATVASHLVLFGLFAWVSAGLLRPALLGGELPKPASRPSFLRLGIVELGVILGLLNALFLCFVLVQARYFFGGTGRVLDPELGLTYAEYARRGFFELVTVTALVLPILLAAHWLLRAAKPSDLSVFKLLAGSLVALLLVVMASALQRMRLYTAEFGLTELRLFTTAFMVWIFAVLIWFLVTVILRDRRQHFAFGALMTGFVAVVVLNIMNPDALIVRTNVARMEAGERFDARYLTTLSADAIPPLVAALPKMTPSNRASVSRELLQRWTPADNADLRTFNLSRNHAASLVEARLGYQGSRTQANREIR